MQILIQWIWDGAWKSAFLTSHRRCWGCWSWVTSRLWTSLPLCDFYPSHKLCRVFCTQKVWGNRSQWEGMIKQIITWVNMSLEKEMVPHPSTLAWKIPWTGEPGRLRSMGSLTGRHDWVTSLSLFIFLLWGRKWQPTPLFLPGESQGRGSLVGYCLRGRTESDTTEVT